MSRSSLIFAVALGHLVPNSIANAFRRHRGVGLVLSLVDLRQSTLRGWVDRLRQRGEDVADLVPPASLLGGGGEHVADRLPEAERAVADGEHRSLHAATLAVAE